MKKKGFTLIELLAVIVILAVIVLIAIPTILGIIENTRKSAYKDSIYGMMDAGEMYLAGNISEYDDNNEIVFTCDGISCSTENGDKLNFKGEVPKSGQLIIRSGGIIEAYYLKNNKYCALGDRNNLNIQKDCSSIDTTTGTVTSSITLTNTPESTKNGYLKEQVASITFSSTNVTNPVYYIKATRKGTSNIDIKEECGEGTIPGECTSIESTKTIEASIWYKVTGNLTVTYNEAASSTATLIVATYDGANYDTSTSATINKIDGTSPTLELGNAATTKTTIIVPITMSDDESGLGTPTCKYYTNGSTGSSSSSTGSYTNQATVSETSCIINGSSNTTYYYQICSNDLMENETCKTGSATTGTISSTITLKNTPTSTQNGYLKEQKANVTFSSTNVTSPVYYIKTTRKGTSSVSTVASCGTGDTPGTCSNSAITDLVAGTWYKVSGDLTVTYNEKASSTATLIAATYDGTEYDTSTTATIDKIDTTSPILELGNLSTITPSSILINYTLSDSESGLGTSTCKYSTINGSYTINGTVTQKDCTISNLSANTTYYYQICVSDLVGNETCKEGNTTTGTMSSWSNQLVSTTNNCIYKGAKCSISSTPIEVVYKPDGVTPISFYVIQDSGSVLTLIMKDALPNQVAWYPSLTAEYGPSTNTSYALGYVESYTKNWNYVKPLNYTISDNINFSYEYVYNKGGYTKYELESTYSSLTMSVNRENVKATLLNLADSSIRDVILITSVYDTYPSFIEIRYDYMKNMGWVLNGSSTLSNDAYAWNIGNTYISKKIVTKKDYVHPVIELYKVDITP